MNLIVSASAFASVSPAGAATHIATSADPIFAAIEAVLLAAADQEAALDALRDAEDKTTPDYCDHAHVRLQDRWNAALLDQRIKRQVACETIPETVAGLLAFVLFLSGPLFSKDDDNEEIFAIAHATLRTTAERLAGPRHQGNDG